MAYRLNNTMMKGSWHKNEAPPQKGATITRCKKIPSTTGGESGPSGFG